MYLRQPLMHSKVTKSLCGAMFSLMVLGTVNPVMAAPISVEDCQKISPVAMAEKSNRVMNSYRYLLEVTNEISDMALRNKLVNYLQNPVATVLQRFMADADKENLKQQLVDAGYVKSDATYNQFLPPVPDVKKAAQPFYSAPGSTYTSHHAYPGGLVTHTAANVRIVEGIFKTYQDTFNFTVDKDVMLAAELMHDMNKPLVFQWQADYALTSQYSIAGTGSHHILSIAEAIYRDFPKEVVVALACAHTPPDNAKDEKQVVDWIKAAAMIAGQNPIAKGYLTADGATLPHPLAIEGFITHLGDHDYVLTEPMTTEVVDKLAKLAVTEYGMTQSDLTSVKFNAFRDYVLSQATTENLYYVLVTKGEAGFAASVKALVKSNI